MGGWEAGAARLVHAQLLDYVLQDGMGNFVGGTRTWVRLPTGHTQWEGHACTMHGRALQAGQEGGRAGRRIDKQEPERGAARLVHAQLLDHQAAAASCARHGPGLGLRLEFKVEMRWR
jgi:hypothetical protein